MKFCFSTRRLQFTLRSLFILITLIALWLGYYANWIHQRREARKWLAQRNCEFPIIPNLRPPNLPLMLRLLGEQPAHDFCVAPLEEDRRNLGAYRAKIRDITLLFPEGVVHDAACEVLK
jgi:hypothetical protein